MVATSGAKLLEDAALDALRTRLLPLASIVTPNIPEAALLLGRRIDDRAGSAHEKRTALIRVLVGVEHDRQQAVLQRVGAENVGNFAGNHRLETVIEQRPRRVLAARAAAEIVAGDQDLRLAVLRLVQHEIRDLFAVGRVAHLVEQVLAETGALDGLQVLLRDDHVGIDIGHR